MKTQTDVPLPGKLSLRTDKGDDKSRNCHQSILRKRISTTSQMPNGAS